MNDKTMIDTDERAVILGEYIVSNQATVRAAANRFLVSKSTVHKDVAERLPAINSKLSEQVKEVLEKNKKERHIRGGLATKRKYEQIALMNHKTQKSD